MLLSIIYIALGFAAMEFSGWFIHKYVMHGPLWMIHKTHHQHSKSFFEWNDLFSLLFGSIAVLLIFLGVETLDYRFWMGIGISLYGALYFVLHDVLVHRRLTWFGKPSQGIYKAHQAHHKTNKKDDAVSFGLFVVPKEFFNAQEK